ncbi:hypothetical protein HZB90_02480 [archaeon]|nr:hypothetical protein [archaeon]
MTTSPDFRGRNIARKLEDILKEQLNQYMIREAADTVLRVGPDVVAALKILIPQKALKELRMKHVFFGGGSIQAETLEGCKRKRDFYDRHYGQEEAVFRAMHPRRIEKLWAKARQDIEARYGKNFQSPWDFKAMEQMFEDMTTLEGHLEDVEETKQIVACLEEAAQESPDEGWPEVAQMWTRYSLAHHAAEAAGMIATIDNYILTPGKLANLLKRIHDQVRYEDGGLAAQQGEQEENTEEDTPEGTTSYYWCSHHVTLEIPHDVGQEQLYDWQLRHLSWKIIQAKSREMPFEDAISLLGWLSNSQELKELDTPDFEGRKPISPELIKNVFKQEVKRQYAARKPDDTCSRFMEQYARLLLKRWQATAVDYERLFSYHIPTKSDLELMRLFYEIKDGEDLYINDKRLTEGRMPALLHELVNEGVIRKEDIQPPLQEYYPSPMEARMIRDHILPAQGGTGARIKLSFTKSEPVIDTTSRTGLLTAGDEKEGAIVLASDLNELENIIDTSVPYEILYAGKHSGLMMGQATLLNGQQGIGRIYRITRVAEGAKPQGNIVTIRGQRFMVTQMANYVEERELSHKVWDANSDMLCAKSHTVITDIPVAEFAARYFKDFMAHVMLHRPCPMTAEEIHKSMESIDAERDITCVERYLGKGLKSRTIFRTFQLGGRFAFTLEMFKDHDFFTEMPVIAGSLIAYLDEVGVPMHHEIELDESGREVAKQKKEEREFQAQNIDQVVAALQGNGLLNALSWALEQDPRNAKYRVDSRGTWAKDPCSTCGQKYVSFRISNNEDHEQSYQGFDTKDLHDLARHPQTFGNRFGSFRKIINFLSDVKDYVPPFISHPDMMPEFLAYIEAQEKAYQLYNLDSYGGQGIGTCEEEELEDDPKLREWARQEQEDDKRLKQAEEIVFDAARKANDKYDSLTGKNTSEGKQPWEIRMFWEGQLQIFRLYQLEAPHLLKGK